jgi:hypothetical protein
MPLAADGGVRIFHTSLLGGDMELLLPLAFAAFVLWAIVAFLQMIGRAIFGAGSQQELPPNPWDQVNQVLAMPVQRPDGTFERARIVWESDPPAGAKPQRSGARQP